MEVVHESSVEGYVVRRAKAKGWIVRKLRWIGRRGAPDRVFLRRGRCVFIEFKRPGKAVRDQQKREFDRLRAAYPEVHQCDSIEEALAILEINDG